MLSDSLEFAIAQAHLLAQQASHEYLTLEHLLLALLEDREVQLALTQLNANIDAMGDEIRKYLTEHCPQVTEYQSAAKPTIVFQRTIQQVLLHTRSAGKEQADCLSALIMMMNEAKSYAHYFLIKHGITRMALMQYFSHGHEQDFTKDHTAHNTDTPKEEETHKSPEPNNSPLALYTLDLNKKAMQGKIDPLIGRAEELERMMQTLCRRRKNNPILVGEAGVGKTAIAEGLALAIVNGNAPKALLEMTVYSLDIGILLAGTKYRGDFETRIKDLLKQIESVGEVILFIDEIHTIVGTGATGNSQVDIVNLLKPALANGQLRVIGTTTEQEYRQIIEKDTALARRFQKITVQEPSEEDSIAILQGLKAHYEAHHDIRYPDESIEAAVRLSTRYLNDRRLPDKAIDIIDEIGAAQRLKSPENRADFVSVAMIEALVAKMARVPCEQVSQDDKALLRKLEPELKARVFGQDEAIVALTNAIKLARAGLRDAEKPIASFLFTGPTGVGKTELSRALAQILGIELLRFDMSEFMQSHTASRLIGAPPGYVGYEQAGQLTEKIKNNPHAVLLLDEIEKAHPDIMNLLLQMMDYGKITDGNGREIDCRHLIILYTSNIGAFEMNKTQIGFNQLDGKAYAKHHVETAIKRHFSPEFRARLDGVITFAPLSKAIIYRVIDKQIKELEDRQAPKRFTLNLSANAKEWLADKGYSAKMGARPLARLIQTHIALPLAEKLLFEDNALENAPQMASVEALSVMPIEIIVENEQLILRATDDAQS